jgi:hypothetical protein
MFLILAAVHFSLWNVMLCYHRDHIFINREPAVYNSRHPWHGAFCSGSGAQSYYINVSERSLQW